MSANHSASQSQIAISKFLRFCEGEGRYQGYFRNQVPVVDSGSRLTQVHDSRFNPGFWPVSVSGSPDVFERPCPWGDSTTSTGHSSSGSTSVASLAITSAGHGKGPQRSRSTRRASRPGDLREDEGAVGPAWPGSARELQASEGDWRDSARDRRGGRTSLGPASEKSSAADDCCM